MNEKRLLFNFLQKHNALQAYKTNFKQFHQRSLIRDEELMINAAFVWHDTPEGHIYIGLNCMINGKFIMKIIQEITFKF